MASGKQPNQPMKTLRALVAAFDRLVWNKPDAPATALVITVGMPPTVYIALVLVLHSDRQPVELKLENIPGSLTVLGGELNLPAEKQTEASVLLEIAPEKLASGSTPIVVGVYVAGKRIDRVKTIFIGPRK